MPYLNDNEMKQNHYVHVCFSTDLKNNIPYFLPFIEVIAATVIPIQRAEHSKGQL